MSQACKTRKGLSAKPALTEFFQPDVVLSSNSSGPQEEDMNIEVKGTLSQSERGPTSGYLSRCANVLFLPLAHILRPFGDYSVGQYGPLACLCDTDRCVFLPRLSIFIIFLNDSLEIELTCHKIHPS